MKNTADKETNTFFWFAFSCGVGATILFNLIWLFIKAKLNI